MDCFRQRNVRAPGFAGIMVPVDHKNFNASLGCPVQFPGKGHLGGQAVVIPVVHIAGYENSVHTVLQRCIHHFFKGFKRSLSYLFIPGTAASHADIAERFSQMKISTMDKRKMFTHKSSLYMSLEFPDSSLKGKVLKMDRPFGPESSKDSEGGGGSAASFIGALLSSVLPAPFRGKRSKTEGATTCINSW